MAKQNGVTQPANVTPAEQELPSTQVVTLTSALFDFGDDDAPQLDELVTTKKVKPRKILGVPWVCVGVARRTGQEDSQKPGEPYYQLTLLFRETGEQSFLVSTSGGFIDGKLDPMVGRVTMQKPVKGCFDLQPDYVPLPKYARNEPPITILTWRSRRGLQDVPFVQDQATEE